MSLNKITYLLIVRDINSISRFRVLVNYLTPCRNFFPRCYAPIKSKLQHPHPPRANPGHLTTSCARGVGSLIFTWVEWRKLNQKCQASSDFLFRAPKSLIAINTCLDDMEEFKGRDRTFVSDWLTKKGLQKL